MKDVFLVYDSSCFYEIVTLGYFMNFSHCDLVYCSLDGKPIKAMEGFSVNVDFSLGELNVDEIRSFIIPGGNVRHINSAEVHDYLHRLRKRNILLAGICAGVDVLDDSGVLENVRSTHSCKDDLVIDKTVITPRANAYVDFAIEVAKELDLFVSEEDLQETIAFWKNHHPVQE